MGQAADARALHWSSASLSHVGAVREVNEDACLDLSAAGVWVVADGMGGYEDGAFASRLIVDSLAQVEPNVRLSGLVDDVEDRLCDVHSRLTERAAGSDRSAVVGSTVAALLVAGRYAVCLWVGDSRVYRLRDNRLEQLTQDHSHVEELIEQGRLTRAEAEHHPDANVITRAVGAGEALYLDARLDKVLHTDRYLICSDGLYREVGEPEIARMMATADCRRVCHSLVDLALERGAHDNVTVVSIAMED
jgi:serine/threonine protein phosphatase PrpC